MRTYEVLVNVYRECGYEPVETAQVERRGAAVHRGATCVGMSPARQG